MKAFLKKHRSLIETALLLLGLLLFIVIFKPPCLLRYFTGISCPGCGISRAAFAVLDLNFKAAFEYHPIWFAFLPASIICLLLYRVKREWIFYTFVGAWSALCLTVWIIRIVSGDPAVRCDLTDGAIYKALMWIWEHLSTLFKG